MAAGWKAAPSACTHVPSLQRLQPLDDQRMVEITVQGVSEDVRACLEAQAKANHRSLEDEGRVLVGHVCTTRMDAFRERTAQLCFLTANRPQTDSVVLPANTHKTLTTPSEAPMVSRQ